MSLENRLSALVTEVGKDVKQLKTNRTVVSPNLSDLPTGGVLIQTGLGDDGSGYTIWFDDGKP